MHSAPEELPPAGPVSFLTALVGDPARPFLAGHGGHAVMQRLGEIDRKRRWSSRFVDPHRLRDDEVADRQKLLKGNQHAKAAIPHEGHAVADTKNMGPGDPVDMLSLAVTRGDWYTLHGLSPPGCGQLGEASGHHSTALPLGTVGQGPDRDHLLNQGGNLSRSPTPEQSAAGG